MSKLLYNCANFTCYQVNAQNRSSYASAVHETRSCNIQAGFRKGRGIRDQIANIPWIIDKKREFRKNIHFCFIDYSKAFGCVDYNKLWIILKEMGIADRLTCLLRNQYACQEAAVRNGHRIMGWFQTGKGVVKAVYCHSAYLTNTLSTSYKIPGWICYKLES